MARHVPERFREKLRDVQALVDIATSDAGRHFDYGREALPGVRVIRAEANGHALALSLWSEPADIAEICGDAAFPATAGLLAIDRDQAHLLKSGGVFVDLSQFTRSESNPGMYYALFDLVSPRQLHKVLHRLVPQLEPHDDRTLVA